MKTTNPIFSDIMEAQTQAINNWMDSAKKVQNAFASGSIATEGQHIYKEWMDKQMNLLNGFQAAAKNGEATNAKPEEFFKNWYNQQMEGVKKVTDFNQSIYSSFANYGKSTGDYANGFSSMNNAWTNIYNSWMSTLNTTFDTLMKNIPGQVNKDAFKNLFETNQVYLKLQEFWQPAFNAMKGGDFSADVYKTYFNPEAYKKLSEQLFGNSFNANNMKAVFDNSIKNIHEFFTNNNNLSKEYYTQMQNIAKEFPQFVGGDFAKLSSFYQNVNNVFGKTFEPLLKLVTPGKEKDNIEANISLLDKLAAFSVKQAELQYHLFQTAQKAVETAAKSTFEKAGQIKFNENQSFNEFYNEWVKINEALFGELFASDDFSKVKGEVLNLGMDVKKHFEKQFENTFSVYPFVFRSEVEELNKTIYELKKQIKQLETRLTISNAAMLEVEEEDKLVKGKKK